MKYKELSFLPQYLKGVDINFTSGTIVNGVFQLGEFTVYDNKVLVSDKMDKTQLDVFVDTKHQEYIVEQDKQMYDNNINDYISTGNK